MKPSGCLTGHRDFIKAESYVTFTLLNFVNSFEAFNCKSINNSKQFSKTPLLHEGEYLC